MDNTIKFDSDLCFETIVKHENLDQSITDIDFTGCDFVYPSGVVPLLARVKQGSSKQINITGLTADLNNYMARMNFHELLGLEYQSGGRNLSNSRFVEIYHFGKDSDHNSIDHKYLEVADCIVKDLPDQVKDSVGRLLEFCISEIVDNARVHSDSNNCFLMAQNYPSKKFVELCVADTGIGMQESLNTKNHEQALINSINPGEKGLNSPGAGNGLYLSSKLVKFAQSDKSKLFILSGDSYLEIGNNSTFLRYSRLFWQGTIVVLRISYDISIDFDTVMGYEPTFVLNYD